MSKSKKKENALPISDSELKEMKKKVALATRMLFHQGLADYHGHVSARIPDTRKLLIKPVLASLASITSKDIMVVDIDAYKKDAEANYYGYDQQFYFPTDDSRHNKKAKVTIDQPAGTDVHRFATETPHQGATGDDNPCSD